MNILWNMVWPITKDRPQRARIFKSEFLEKGTYVHPLTPFLFWIPVIGVLFNIQAQNQQLSALGWAGLVFIGIFAWTFAEYWIHRLPFHLDDYMDVKSPLIKRAVYIMHGNHHEDPADPWRGVMPIIPAVVYASLLYLMFSLFVPAAYLDGFFGGFLIGYLMYDGIHYYTHHGKPKNAVLNYLRKSHLIHHVHHNRRYGISQPFWDFVFRTH